MQRSLSSDNLHRQRSSSYVEGSDFALLKPTATDLVPFSPVKNSVTQPSTTSALEASGSVTVCTKGKRMH